MKGFDPAAEFLLDLAWPNLFDPTPYDDMLRCRGCDDLVGRWKAAGHHEDHRRQRAREARKRREALTRQRVANLRRARSA